MGKGKEITLNDCRIFAESKNGKCLSLTYENANKKMFWQCKLGHQWFSTYGNIFYKNKWCPECYGNKKLDINYARQLGLKNNCELISDVYINSTTKLKWKCKFGHFFEKSINIIHYNKSWCPRCSNWCSEEICRLYFETLFKMKFDKVRPDWLLNDRGNKMELDGLGEHKISGKFIAFEHQGEQHYKRDKNIGKKNYFYSISLEQRIIDDKRKLQLCNENNIVLIQIPQLIKATKLENLPFIIKDFCILNDIEITNIDFEQKVSLDTIHKSSMFLNQIKSIAIQKGGVCISSNYINAHTKMIFKCANEHIFEMTSNNFKRGRWCKQCWIERGKSNEKQTDNFNS